MAKKSILPLIALGGVAFLLLKKNGGLSEIEQTAKGIARKVKATIEHGDLLGGPHDFRPIEVGDTLVLKSTPEDWEYSVEFMGQDQKDIEEQYQSVDLHHDKKTGTLYATAIIPGSQFGSGPETAGEYAEGLENRVFIIGRPPSSSQYTDPKQVVAMFSKPS